MKCPACGEELVFNSKRNVYLCRDSFCDYENGYLKEFAEFKCDVSMMLTDNRVYGPIFIAISLEDKTVLFQVSKHGLL